MYILYLRPAVESSRNSIVKEEELLWSGWTGISLSRLEEEERRKEEEGSAADDDDGEEEGEENGRVLLMALGVMGVATGERESSSI